MLILILILLIKTFNKISFKNFLSINDMMHSEFTHMMTLIFRKIKNIIKITKYHFLKMSLIFDIFFDINSMIKHSKFTKYIVFSIFFCSLLTISLLLTKIIVIFIMKIINVVFELSIKMTFLKSSIMRLKTILLMFLILFLQALK